MTSKIKITSKMKDKDNLKKEVKIHPEMWLTTN